MPWNAITDAVLSGSRREQELEVEERSEYQQWRNQLETEIQVFVRQVHDLELSDSEDRSKFYSLRKDLAKKIQELRDRCETANAPVDALIEMEELIEVLLESSNKISVSVSYIGGDSMDSRRSKKRQRDKEQRRTEIAVERRNKIAEQIESLSSCFEESLY